MAKLAVLFVVLAVFALESGATVIVPFPEDNLIITLGLQAQCKVTNESFIGWFKSGDSTKIPQVPTRADVKDQPMVVEKSGPTIWDKLYLLVFPSGLTAAAGGKYICKGNESQAELSVHVRFSLRALKISQQLHLGTSGQILLGAHSYPVSKFTWNKGGVAIDFSDPRLTLDREGNIGFTNVRKSDAGEYEVEINWEDRIIVKPKITVAVVEKPSFLTIPSPKKLTGVKGYDYKFCCDAKGLPTPTLAWTKKQGANEVAFDVTNSRYSRTSNCIGIKTLEQGDAAIYNCTATNIAGQIFASVEILKVGEAPSVDAFAQDSYQTISGDAFDLACTGKGDPAATVEWTSTGKPPLNQKKNGSKSTATFSKLIVDDSGNLTCTSRNGLFYNGKELTASRTVVLKVAEKPSVNEQASIKTVYSYLNNPNAVYIRCVFNGVPVPSVVLAKGGVQLANGSGVVKHTFLTKKNAQFGDYVCTATNIHGSATHTVKLVQADLPGKPIEVKATQTCKDILLTWKPPTNTGGLIIQHYIITAIKDGNQLTKDNTLGSSRSFDIAHDFKAKTTYQIEIRARNGIGVGNSEKLDVTTEKYCKPGAPTLSNLGGIGPMKVVKGPDVLVQWRVPAYNGLDDNLEYELSWRPKVGTTTITTWSQTDKIKETEYTIKGLDDGQYDIKVVAINRAGRGRADVRVVEVNKSEEPPVYKRSSGGLSKGAVAGIVIAILLIILITIDLFCCFFNSCGLIFCCQKACCGQKYEPDGKSSSEMEKLEKNPPPQNV